MDKKKLKIISVLLAFMLCFPIHFLYDVFPSFITSIFAPVNESIWEHMKILFGSVMLAGVAQKIYVVATKQRINNICFSNFTAALISIPIFLIMFLPIYFTIGHNMIITLILMFITIVLVEAISYIMMNQKDFKLENVTIFLAISIYIIFTILTYYPINNSLFIDPIDNYHVIKRER